jgi:hypothetical protein
MAWEDDGPSSLWSRGEVVVVEAASGPIRVGGA